MSWSRIKSRVRGEGAKPSSRARARGMTLVEILIVMGLMGLMLSAASISLGAASQGDIIKATNEVASTMRFAFDKARVSGTHLRMKINFEERSFTLQAAGQAMYLPATGRDGEIVVVDEDDLDDRKDRDERAADRYNRSLSGQLMQQVQGAGQALSFTFSPERNVLSTDLPLSRFLILVRTKAPPLPGFTCWK